MVEEEASFAAFFGFSFGFGFRFSYGGVNKNNSRRVVELRASKLSQEGFT